MKEVKKDASCVIPTPKNIKTRTQLTPEDMDTGKKAVKKPGDSPSEEEIDEDTILINPDVDSMESRG